MLVINLFDNSNKHLHNIDGNFSFTHTKLPINIRYSLNNMVWEGITVFTEDYIFSNIVDKVKSTYKIAWLIECKEFSNYTNISKVLDKFDYILTHDSELLNKFPDKAIFIPLAGCWIDPSHLGIVHNKNKNVSMIFSNKNFMSGHRLRHEIHSILNGIDFYGTGCNNYISDKIQGLANYRFSIVVENSKNNNYFTEKLLDCFTTRTIPIYWGAPNIDEFFDIDGIIVFNTITELINILNNLSEELYDSKLKHIQNNLSKVNKYMVIDDFIYFNLYKDLAFKSSHSRWSLDKAEKLRFSYNLTGDSVVLDVGGYVGDYTKVIYNLYKSNIFLFEPVKDFYDHCKLRFTDIDKVKCFNYGVGANTSKDFISVEKDGSTFYSDGVKEECSVLSYGDMLNNTGLSRVDLLKLNIEGAEYDLLDYIIDSGFIKDIKNIVVQFHNKEFFTIQNPEIRRDHIREKLSRTHTCTFCYPFIWESWSISA